ncbi:hypothetical protein QQX98_007759 [Neonectria punicea]|uniref:DUF7779 domain-containing protein n=1 Tax=Neonectria punicea TaxID=979145 RepID=A0ABR1GX22_9HYPO
MAQSVQGAVLPAEISYFEPLDLHTLEKPYISNVPFVETDGAWNSLIQVKHRKQVIDIRSYERDFSIAKNGFEYVKHSFTHPPVDRIDSFDDPYVAEVEQFLKGYFRSDMVLMYDAIANGYFQQADAVCTLITLQKTAEEWLIVFDNADDIELLLHYWPAANNGSILVTSRDPAVTRRTHEGERVESMVLDDAKDMFFSAINKLVMRNEHTDQLGEKILLELDVTSLDCEHSLATVWNISLQNIDAQSTQLLRIFPYLDPDGVPVSLLRKGAHGNQDAGYLASATTFLQVSRQLMKHGLCARANVFCDTVSELKSTDPATTAITTHRLVLQTTFHRSSETEKACALAQAVALLVSEFPAVSESQFRLSSLWKECHMLPPHVEAVMARCDENQLQLPSEFVPVLCAGGRYLVERRSFAGAEKFFTTAEDICKAHGLQDWKQAQFVKRSLGGILLESTALRFDEAVREVVTHYEATLEPEDPILGVTYSDLAQALTAKGNYDEDISLCKRALSIVSKMKDDKARRDTRFHVHHNMARIYEMMGLPDEAYRLHLFEGDAQGKGLREEQSVYGAWNLYAIGNCLRLQKDPRAMEIHAKALKIRQDLLGDHYYTAISYHKLGQLHLENGQFQEADDAFQQAHKILKDPLGNTEAELARTLWYWSLAKEKLPQEQEKSAQELRKEALRTAVSFLNQAGGEEDKWSNDDFDNLVVYYNR